MASGDAYLSSYLKTIITCKRLGRLVLAIGILVAVKLIISHFASGAPSLSFVAFMKSLLAISIVKPAVFYLAHVLYYGPIIMIAAFVWNRCCAHVLQQGLGLSLVLLLGVVMSIGSESRQIIVFFPLLVLFVVKTLEEWPLSQSFYIGFILISLLYSKVWVNVNSGLNDKSDIREFPWQKFFSSVGYIMSNEMYYIQGAITLAVVALFYWFYFRRLALTVNRYP